MFLPTEHFYFTSLCLRGLFIGAVYYGRFFVRVWLILPQECIYYFCQRGLFIILSAIILLMKTTNFGTMFMVEDSESLVTPLPGQTFIIKLIEAISQIKYSLDIIQYQWNFYPGQPESNIQRLNRTVLAQAQAGKKVRVLLNKEGRGQHLMAINMKAAQFLGEAGIVVKFGRTFPITHAKLWIFDDDAVILGSHNLSSRSVTVNNEVSVLIKSRPVAVEYRRYFNALWGLS